MRVGDTVGQVRDARATDETAGDGSRPQALEGSGVAQDETLRALEHGKDAVVTEKARAWSIGGFEA